MSYLMDQKQKHMKEPSIAEQNKQLWKEKMQALNESKGDLGELVKKTPGASAKVIHSDGSEETISEGPKVNKYGLKE